MIPVTSKVKPSFLNGVNNYFDLWLTLNHLSVLESKRADGKLGDKYGKSFGRLKTELGIGGGRQKGFHSFRVHMATNLEQAGVAESRAVWILGHTRNLSLSYGLYSKGPSLEQLREDVEAAVGYGLREELGGAW